MRSAEAEGREGGRGQIGEEEEEAVTMAAEARDHLYEETDEVRVDESEGSLAVGAGESREPPENGGARARVSLGGVGEGGVVEGDVSSERVEQLLRFHSHLSHTRSLRRRRRTSYFLLAERTNKKY